jgi:hypothetical protein
MRLGKKIQESGAPHVINSGNIQVNRERQMARTRKPTLKTSLNMGTDTLTRVTWAAEQLDRPMREIVVILLRRVMRDIDRFQGGFTLVKYQKGRPGRKWHCFCIEYYEDENEFFTDLRKLSRFSLSNLVAIAAKRYLLEIVRGEKNGILKYLHYCDYLIRQQTIDGIRSWIFYWGIPEKRMNTYPPATILRFTGLDRPGDGNAHI